MRRLGVFASGFCLAFGLCASGGAERLEEESDSRFFLEFRHVVPGGPCSTDAIGMPGENGPVLEVEVGDRFEVAVMVRVLPNGSEDAVTGWQISLCHDSDLVRPVDFESLEAEGCEPTNPHGFWREGSFLKSLHEGMPQPSSTNFVTWRSGEEGEGITQGLVIDLFQRDEFLIREDMVLESVVVSYEAVAAGCATFRFDGDSYSPCSPLGSPNAELLTSLVAVRSAEPESEVVVYMPNSNGRAILSIGGACDYSGAAFVRGDANGDGVSDLSDATGVLGCLFLDTSCPSCLDAADSNDDGEVDIADPVHLLGYLFLGEPAPPVPFGDCGSDPTADSLDCGTSPACP